MELWYEQASFPIMSFAFCSVQAASQIHCWAEVLHQDIPKQSAHFVPGPSPPSVWHFQQFSLQLSAKLQPVQATGKKNRGKKYFTNSYCWGILV